jgi:hypothetical protein
MRLWRSLTWGCCRFDSPKFGILKKLFNFVEKIRTMTKSIIINYNEADENILMVIFEKFKVTTKNITESEEVTVVRQRLHTKYVQNGTWHTMSDEEKEDAAHAETMMYAQEQPDHHVFSAVESKAYRKQLRQKLTEHAEY